MSMGCPKSYGRAKDAAAWRGRSQPRRRHASMPWRRGVDGNVASPSMGSSGSVPAARVDTELIVGGWPVGFLQMGDQPARDLPQLVDLCGGELVEQVGSD